MRQDNKEQQFKSLYTENYPQLYYSALYFLRDAETAKDIVDDMFTELWEHFDPAHKAYTFSFLYTNVRNRCIDFARHADVENRFIKLYIELNKDMQQDEAVERDERLEAVYKILEELPAKTRFVVEQCYFNNKRYAEVAEVMGITTNGIRKHIMKALAAVREKLCVNYKKGKYTKEG
jgi:RNA polymerase sigma-70 factor (family 1)